LKLVGLPFHTSCAEYAFAYTVSTLHSFLLCNLNLFADVFVKLQYIHTQLYSFYTAREMKHWG